MLVKFSIWPWPPGEPRHSWGASPLPHSSGLSPVDDDHIAAFVCHIRPLHLTVGQCSLWSHSSPRPPAGRALRRSFHVDVVVMPRVLATAVRFGASVVGGGLPRVRCGLSTLQPLGPLGGVLGKSWFSLGVLLASLRRPDFLATALRLDTPFVGGGCPGCLVGFPLCDPRGPPGGVLVKFWILP